MAVVVLSLFVLDLVMPPADLAIWPNAGIHLGLGLWRRLPTGWWFVELAVIAAGLAYYWPRSRADRSFGHRPLAGALVVFALHIFNSPWLTRIR